MVLEAPSDVTRATASINWLTRQLKSLEDYPVTIKADWPGRTPTTAAALVAVIDNPKILIPGKISSVPKALEVVFVDDLGARFQGAKTFVQATTEALPAFYSKVGQSLKAWIPKPPKIKSDDKKAPESQAEKNEIKQVNETQYYYFITGAEKQVGPVGESDILKISKENPTSDIRVWHEGLTSWTPFEKFFKIVFWLQIVILLNVPTIWISSPYPAQKEDLKIILEGLSLLDEKAVRRDQSNLSPSNLRSS